MNAGWDNGAPRPVATRRGPGAVMRLTLRIVPLAVLVFGMLLVLVILRQIERPLFGQDRPWTPYLTQFVCIGALWIIGLRLDVRGSVAADHGAVVANHSSWLDIFVLNAIKRIYFVSKAEVAGWIGIGWLARATGTVFVERNRKHARAQRDMLRDRLNHGHKLLFFPEGTSTDGQEVIAFKSTLFDALFNSDTDGLTVQPVSVRYTAPPGEDPRFYGWWADMAFGPHLLKVLAAPRQGSVTVTFHPPLRVTDFANRKALATACQITVASEFRPSPPG